MANRMTFEIGYKSDKSGLSEIKRNLADIQKLTSSDLMRIDKGLNVNQANTRLMEIKQSALDVQKALERSFNVNLNTTNISKFNRELKALDLNKLQRDFAAAGQVGQTAFRNVTANVLTTNIQLKQTHKSLDNIAKTMGNTVKWGVTSAVFNNITSSLSSAVGYVKALDSSLSDIRIVSGRSADEMERFAVQANEATRALSSTTLDYTNAALIYYQQGLSESDVTARTETTIKMANATKDAAEDVSSYMTAIWNNFDNGTKSLEYYADAITALGASTAASSSDIAQGLQKYASIAETVGLSYEYATAALATVVDKTQQSADTIGTAFKTIFSRFQDLKLGDTLEDGTDLGTYSQALEKVGVDIKTASGSLKEMDVIIDDLGDKWVTLGTDQKIALAQAVAGTRQYTQLVSLMDNYEAFKKNVDIAADSVGTLDKQNRVYAESVTAYANRAKAAIQGAQAEFLDEDSIKSYYSIIETLADRFKDLVSVMGGGSETLLAFGSIATQVFSRQIANGISTMITNFQIAKQNASDLNATISVLQTFQNANLGDARTQKLIDMKQQIIDVKNVLTETQQAELEGMITSRNQLDNDIEAWETRKQKAEEYYKVLKGQGESLNLGTTMSEADSEKIAASIEPIIQNFKNASKVVNTLKQDLSSLPKAVNSDDANGIAKTVDSIQNLTIDIEDLIAKQQLEEEQLNDLTIAYNKYQSIISGVPYSLNDEELAYEIAANQNLENSLKNLAETYDRVSKESIKSAKEMTSVVRDEVSGTTATLEAASQEMDSGFITTMQRLRQALDIQKITQTIGALGSLGSSFNSILNTVDQFKQGEMTIGRFLTTMFTQIPMVVYSISTLNKALGLSTTITTAWSAAMTSATAASVAGAGGFMAAAAGVQAFVVALGPVGWAIGAIGLLGGAFIGLFNASKKAKEAAIAHNLELVDSSRAAEEALKSVKSLSEEYDSLRATYESTGESKDEFVNSTKKLCEELGIEYDALDLLSGKYDEVNKKIAEKKYAMAKESLDTAKEARDNATKDIEKDMDTVYSSGGDKVKGLALYNGGLNDEIKKTFAEVFGDAYFENAMGAVSLDAEGDIAEFAKKANEVLRIAEEKGQTNSSLYRNLEEWLISNEQMIDQYAEQNDYMKAAASTMAEQALALEGQTTGGIDSLEGYQNYMAQYKEKLQKELTESGVKTDEEDVEKLAKDFAAQFDNLGKYLLDDEMRKDLSKRLLSGIVDEANLKEETEKLQSLFNSPDWELILQGKVLVDEANSIAEIQERINQYRLELPPIDPASIEKISDAVATLFEGEELDADKYKEVSAALQQIASDYEEIQEDVNELDRIFDKSSDNFRDKLQMISEKIQQLDIKQKQKEVNDFISDAQKEMGKNLVLGLDVDDEKLTDRLDEIAKAEYEVLVSINNDWQDDVDNMEASINQINDAAELIGEKFIVAANDIREVGNAFPGILENMTILKDGSVQLSRQIVEQSMASANAEMQADKTTVISKLKNQKQELLAKATTAQNIANIAGQLASDELMTDEQKSDAIAQLDASLSELQQQNSKDTTQTEVENMAEVGKQSATTGEEAARNVGRAYQAMVQTSAQAAQAMKQNLQTGMTGEGSIVNTITSASLSLSGGQVSGAPKTGETTSQVDKSNYSSDDWKKTQDYYQALADAYRNSASDLDSAIAQVEAQAQKAASGLKDAGKSKSKKKSGSKKDPETMELVEQEYDRYKDINNVLAKIENKLTKVDRAKNRAFGKNYLKQLDKELSLLKQQNDALSEKLSIAKKDKNEQKSSLKKQGVKFEGDDITNYEEIIKAKTAQVNAIISKYNAMSATQQEKYKDTVEKAKKELEKLKSDIDEFQTMVYETIPGIQDEMEENLDRELALNLEKITYEIDLKINVNDLQRQWNEFQRKVINGIKDDDIIGGAKQTVKDYSTYYNQKGTGDVQTLTKGINDVLEGMKNGTLSQADGMEQLQQYAEDLMNAMMTVEDMIDSVNQAYLDMIDEAADAFAKQLEQYEYVSNEIEHQKELISLLYGEDAYGMMEDYYTAAISNNQAQVGYLAEQVEFYKEKMAEEEEGSEAYLSYQEKMQEAQSSLNEKIEDGIKLLQDEYLNTLNSIVKEMEDALTGGLGMDKVNQEWEDTLDYMDTYLTDVDKAYEIQKLRSKYQNAIDSTDDLDAQKKLTDLMNQQIDALKDKENLTKYDVERANQLYEIGLKELALQEAMNAKSEVQLTRDASGGYSYQFVADKAALADLQEQLADATQKLYQMDLEEYQNTIQAAQDLWEEYKDRFLEINSDMTLSEEEKLAKNEELNEWYSNKALLLGEKTETAKYNLTDSTFKSYMTLYQKDAENMKELMTDKQIELVEEALKGMTSDYAGFVSGTSAEFTKLATNYSTTLNGKDGLTLLTSTAAGQMAGEYAKLYQTKDPSKTAIGAVITGTDKAATAASKYKTQLNQLASQAGVTFGKDGIKSNLDKTITSTESLNKKSQELFTTYGKNIQTMKDMVKQVNTLAESYLAAKKAAEEALKAAKKYIDKKSDTSSSSSGSSGSTSSGNSSGNSSSSSSGSGSGTSGSTQGNGKVNVGDKVAVKGKAYWQANGPNVADHNVNFSSAYVVDYDSDYKYPVAISKTKGGTRYGWFSKSDISGFDTGGYTGDWGGSGKLAVLHEKEIVLNKTDTANILEAVRSIRGMDNIISSIKNTMNKTVAGITSSIGSNLNSSHSSYTNNNSSNQSIVINAEFPSVNSSFEIERAFDNLLGEASQYAEK